MGEGREEGRGEIERGMGGDGREKEMGEGKRGREGLKEIKREKKGDRVCLLMSYHVMSCHVVLYYII